MKDKLQHAMKPTPERFRYTVQSAIGEATAQSEKPKRRISKGWRIAIAVVLIAALIPTSIFGASKLYELIAKPVDNYGLELDVERETAADYPKYVKMHVDIPDGFAVVPNTDDLKYYSLTAEQPYTDGFSLYPMRYEDDSQKAVIANVDSYEECIISGHPAYKVSIINVKGTWEQLYVYFEDVNVMLLIYHKDVTDEQLSNFVAGISFTEGTADDHTALGAPYDERRNTDVTYKYEEIFIEQPSDIRLTFKHYSPITEDESLRYTAQITDIRVTDSIDGLDESCFNTLYTADTIADTNGHLLPKDFRTFCEGDGFETAYEELSIEQKEQKMIIAEITYDNLSDEDINLYIPYRLEVLNQDGENRFTHAETIDAANRIYSTACCDTEITYLSPHGEGKSFYIPILKAHETMTVTVGIRCNADMLDKAFLDINGISDVVDPVCEGIGDYSHYLFKVTDDDR